MPFANLSTMATSNSIISLRRHDLDNLRTFLTGLVTVHHTSIAYSGTGGWPFKSAAFSGASPLILGFNMFNQSFFMGIFFWISGRVSAQSLQKRTNLSEFLKNKTLRLAVPALAYTLIVNPIMHAMIRSDLSWKSALGVMRDYFSNLRGVRGPVWYTATLLCFDAIAGLISTAGSQYGRGKKGFQLYEQLRKHGWLVVAVLNFLAKTRYPVGRSLPVINLQPAYMFQYIYAYTLGYLGYYHGEQIMRGPFDIVSLADRKKEGKAPDMEAADVAVLRNAFILSLLSMSLIAAPRYLDSADWLEKTTAQLFGGWNMPSLLYAIWNEISFNVFAPSLMVYFQRRYSQRASHSIWNARYSYATFLIHTPVTVTLQVIAESILMSDNVKVLWTGSRLWEVLGPVIMTSGIGMASVWASSLVAGSLLEWVPILTRVL